MRFSRSGSRLVRHVNRTLIFSCLIGQDIYRDSVLLSLVTDLADSGSADSTIYSYIF